MYMQVPSGAGKEDEVGKMTDVSAIVPLLQAIFAICSIVARLYEQSLLIARLSQPSLLGQLQSEALLSPSSSCSYQTKPRVCCEVMSSFIVKVSGMVDKVSTGVGWTKQLFGALYSVREGAVRAVNLIGCVRIIE